MVCATLLSIVKLPAQIVRTATAAGLTALRGTGTQRHVQGARALHGATHPLPLRLIAAGWVLPLHQPPSKTKRRCI
jgi:hypothetical protein